MVLGRARAHPAAAGLVGVGLGIDEQLDARTAPSLTSKEQWR